MTPRKELFQKAYNRFSGSCPLLPQWLFNPHPRPFPAALNFFNPRYS